MTTPRDIDEVWALLQDRLTLPGYDKAYATETAFEQALWPRVVGVAREFGWDVQSTCLTSHACHSERSAHAWKDFLAEETGPDVAVLGSRNRLDIVLRHPSYGSIGIEVKCLGSKGHAAKLTQSLGQAFLGLFHRDRTIVAIHCGTVSDEARERLRAVVERICHGTRVAVVVAP